MQAERDRWIAIAKTCRKREITQGPKQRPNQSPISRNCHHPQPSQHTRSYTNDATVTQDYHCTIESYTNSHPNSRVNFNAAPKRCHRHLRGSVSRRKEQCRARIDGTSSQQHSDKYAYTRNLQQLGITREDPRATFVRRCCFGPTCITPACAV